MDGPKWFNSTHRYFDTIDDAVSSLVSTLEMSRTMSVQRLPNGYESEGRIDSITIRTDEKIGRVVTNVVRSYAQK